MSRISSLRALRIAAAVVVLTALSVDAGRAVAVELKLAHFMSTRHPMHRFMMKPWTEEVAKLSNNALTVRIYPGGQLGKGPRAQFKRAIDRVGDVVFGLQGFTSAAFPRTLLIELPGIAPDNVTATKMLWGAIDHVKEDYKRVKLLALWNSDITVIMSRDKAVRRLEDLKGMKIRASSKQHSNILAALGATPVFMPITKVYNAVNTRVLDGLMSGASAIRSFKLAEVVKFYTQGPFAPTTFFLVMNKDSYNGLSAGHRALIDKTTGRGLSVKAAEIYHRATVRNLAGVRKSGSGEIITLAPAEEKRWRTTLANVRSDAVKRLEAKGIPAAKILSALEAGR